MYMATGDPVTDAERHQQYLDETYPEKEGAVRMTLDVWVTAKGGDPVELMNNAYDVIKEAMSHRAVSEWDFEFREVEIE